MMRRLAMITGFVLALGSAAMAQEQDSVFEDYDAYAAYVDASIMQRDFVPMIQRLGGRDEFTPEQLASTNRQMLGIWPRNFENVTVFNRTDLGGGIWQEGRIYWNGTNYAYFYALLHERGSDMVVINFLLNSSSTPIMDRF